ncbi:Metallophosphoesterase [Trichinella spiralis]|uniref:Metallophosphoesterase n=1 Tax=Trichinella spiralis TaxID=6334 RepID=A0ABR3K697_TRISP
MMSLDVIQNKRLPFYRSNTKLGSLLGTDTYASRRDIWNSLVCSSKTHEVCKITNARRVDETAIPANTAMQENNSKAIAFAVFAIFEEGSGKFYGK